MKITINIPNKFLFRIFTFLITTLFTLFLIEGSLIVLNKFNKLPYQNTKISYNKFRGKPGQLNYNNEEPINSKGFNDNEFDFNSKNKRIIALGDSYAYGVVPKKHNYLTLLENHLNKSKLKTDVINMGIPGIGIIDYYNLLKDEGIYYKPDTILICFFSGNDFDVPASYRKLKYFEVQVENSSTYLTTVQAHNKDEARKKAVKKYNKDKTDTDNRVIKFTFLEKDKIYNFEILNIIEYWLNRKDLNIDMNSYSDNSPTFPIQKFLKDEKIKAKKFLVNDKSIDKKWDYVIDYFQRINTVGDSIGSKVIFVLQPEELQVSEELQNTIKNLQYYKNDTFDFHRTNRMLTQKMDSLNLTYIDLLEPFVEKGKTTTLYKPQDTHWNIAGNKLAAEILYDQLK